MLKVSTMTLQKAAIKFAAPILLAACWAPAALAQPAALGRPTVLVHGNYCGPGNNASLPPIDALDAACARHDACTPSVGLPTKACNRRLELEAGVIARDLRQPQDLRVLAGFVAAFAAANPSDTSPEGTPEAILATAVSILPSALK